MIAGMNQLPISEGGDPPCWAHLLDDARGDIVYVNPAFTRTQAGDGPPAHGASGAGHVCFRASPAEQAAWKEHLAVRGIATERVMDWPGGGQSFYVRDPAGNSVEFAEARIWKL